MSILPPKRPQLPESRARELLRANGVTANIAILGIRGYYLNSMGGPGNQRGLYDDALFIVGPRCFKGFNANTDPSIRRPGIATLKPGVHPYKRGKHGISRPGGGYPALRPATLGERLPVTRDGVDGTQYGVALNIHKGSRTTTSSEGCQTIHPDQWPEFIGTVYALMDAFDADVIQYCLIVNDGSVA